MYKDKSGMILTRSRKRIPVKSPRPEDICIEDIAFALSREGRYANHVPKFVSVAQHSILVSRICLHRTGRKDLALAGLLHDASEAFLGDVTHPLKSLPEMDGYRMIELVWMDAIAQAFGISPEHLRSDTVRHADLAAAVLEARYFWVDDFPEDWVTQEDVSDLPDMGSVERFFSRNEAISFEIYENAFLNCYNELSGGSR